MTARGMVKLASLLAVLLSTTGFDNRTAAHDEGICFKCTETWVGDPTFAFYHEDWVFGGGTFHELARGNMHDMNWSSCLNAISVAGHIQYNGGNLLEDVDEAVVKRTDRALRKVLAEHRNVELNVQRSAIQVIDEGTDLVLYHAKLPHEQVERLASGAHSRLRDR